MNKIDQKQSKFTKPTYSFSNKTTSKQHKCHSGMFSNKIYLFYLHELSPSDEDDYASSIVGSFQTLFQILTIWSLNCIVSLSDIYFVCLVFLCKPSICTIKNHVQNKQKSSIISLVKPQFTSGSKLTRMQNVY